jgi:potassium efflux system protein
MKSRTGRVVIESITLLLLLPSVVRAQASGVAGAAVPTPADAVPPSLSTLGEQAETVANKLRAMTEAIADRSAVVSLENEVFRYHRSIADHWTETDRLLREAARRAPLESLASSWGTLRAQLIDMQAVVDERARQREADLRTLDRLRTTWSWTLDHAHQVGAPGSVVDRVEATLATIEATRAQVEQRDARLVVLQDAVTRQIEACDEAADRIEQARRRAVARVFSRREPPIWSLSTLPAERAARIATADPATEFAARIDSLRIYYQAHQPGFVLTLLLAIASSLTLYRARSRRGLHADCRPALPTSVARVLDAPLPTAVLLTLMLSRPWRPDPPLALQHLVLLITLPAATMLLKPLLDPRLGPALYALVAFLVLDIGRPLLVAARVEEQVILFLEMGAAAALLFWFAAALPTSRSVLGQQSPWLRRAARALFRGLAVAAAAASVATVLGYLELADLAGGGALGLAYVSIGLLGIRVAAGGVLGLLLVATPLARLRTIEHHGAAVERGVGRALDVIVAAAWVLAALQLFELVNPAAAVLRGVLDARLRVGELDLSADRALGVAVFVVVAWLTARILLFALDEDVYARLDLPRGVPYALSTLTRYGLLLVGFLLALGALGFDLTRVTILVSAFGLGIGFGLQQIINNFVSGLILLFERPIQVGDSVQLGDLLGEVMRIGIRSSTIRTVEGAEVIVSNASLLEDKLTNWTLSDRKRRVTVDIGVAYGTDAARVIALLGDVARQFPEVLPEPAPDALLVGFGDSALDFQLRFWTEQSGWARLRSDLCVALQGALTSAGIQVPFPQREVHIRSASGQQVPACEQSSDRHD